MSVRLLLKFLLGRAMSNICHLSCTSVPVLCFAGSFNWVSMATNGLLLILSPLLLSYHSGLALNHGCRSLIDVNASSEIALCKLEMLSNVATSRFTDTFQSGSTLLLDVPYLEALPSSVTKLLDAIRVCFIVGGTRFDADTLLMAGNAMECVD